MVKIWNKPKFVLNSNYVITLDHIAERDIALVENLLVHKNIEAQVEEWRQRGIVDESFKKADVLETDLTGTRLAKPYQYPPIDTKSNHTTHDIGTSVGHCEERRDEAISGVPWRRWLRCARNDPVANPRCANLVWSDLGTSKTWNWAYLAYSTTLTRRWTAGSLKVKTTRL